MRRQRQHHKEKKHTILWILLIGVLLGFCAVLVFMDGQKKGYDVSDTETELTSGTEDVVVYNGEEYFYNDHLSNFLFLGIDTRGEVDSYSSQRDAGQADAIFLVSLDRVQKSVQLLSIPRDTMAEVEFFNPSGRSLGKTKDHINLQYAIGDGKHKSCDLMEKAVSELLFGVPIQGYCSLNMDGISVLAELAGGVEVVVPDDVLEEVNPEFQEGATVTLTKDNIEQFVRSRDVHSAMSTLVRLEHQQVFLKAFLEKARVISEQDASFVTKMYEGLEPYMVTNMSNDLFARLLEASTSGVKRQEVLPGEGVRTTKYDEYHADEEALQSLIYEMFYEKR